jgi:FlaA1/EpsC-like NDP-sugar epimerase
MSSAQKRNIFLAPLLLAAAISYTGAFLLRFEFVLPHSVEGIFYRGLLIYIFVKCFAWWAFRLHANTWRFASLFDLSRLITANITASTVACAATLMAAGPSFPRSVYVIDAALCLLATAGIQLSARVYWEVFVPNAAERQVSRTIFIYGAGAAGLMLGKEIRSNVSLGLKLAGYLDDDESKQGDCLMGIPILGKGEDASRLVGQFAQQKKPISEIIVAMPSATARQMRAAVAHCRAAGVPCRTLPSLGELLSGEISRQIREVSVNDLLGREPVRIEEDRIGAAIAGESVLVTGGCGSIGSELCRQIARFNPRKLVIFDQAESEMFMLAMELRRRYPKLNLVTEIGDIFRAPRVRDTMTRQAISVVFHAAAYKHVPLMEEHILEAIENNVIGTYNVALAASRNDVKRFVLISSDKAVNPTSIMGVTKRVAELIVSAMPLDGRPKAGAFVSVRFGNVLGSAGSVIPIFQRQIAAGGPVTVTHSEMRRYFMSTAEAVQLVLQASTLGEGSEIFELDMGEPVRIMELAQNMIRLAGLVPGEDIDIHVTGLRPGEKLFEELYREGENILPTSHEQIKRFRSQAPEPRYVARWLERLRVVLMEDKSEALKAHLLLLVPEYQGAAALTGDRSAARLNLVAAQAS